MVLWIVVKSLDSLDQICKYINGQLLIFKESLTQALCKCVHAVFWLWGQVCNWVLSWCLILVQ